MKTTGIGKRSSLAVVIASLAGLTACTTYVERRPPPPVVYTEPAPVEPAPPPVYVQPATVEVVIRDERDFYEPLSPYGHWEYIGSYGRCWIPNRVESNWRPYSNGHWEQTDAGWYWVSDEPWGWATYHYGRWDFDAHFGWFWVPQTMWAPAWVTWHRGGGYVGWTPLPPSARIAGSGVVEVNARAIPPRGYVFVEERRFLEPVRTATVVNNTTIINKTVNITNIKVVNNTVINEGPRAQEIEQVSGRKLRTVPARDLRHKIEAPVAASQRARGNERDAGRATTPAPPLTGITAPAPGRAETDSDRKAAERAHQQQVEADHKAQAQAERVRKAESENKARLQAEQQRKAEAEAARRTHETDVRAREQAARDARQKQAQTGKARAQSQINKTQSDSQNRAPTTQPADRKNETARDAQRQSQQNQPVNARPPEVRRGAVEQKNLAEADRRGTQQHKGNAKGQNKKAKESQPTSPATNTPASQ